MVCPHCGEKVKIENTSPWRMHVEKVRAKMIDMGLNQTGLADQVDMARENLNRALNGRIFLSEKSLMRIADALDMPFEDVAYHIGRAA